MKIACSSESFARTLASGERTQLEWLDACANELECDGVVFGLDQFPRTDAEYLAQLKKIATDLGLCVAALSCGAATWRGDEFAIATALGAPLVVVAAPAATGDAAAWGDFTAALSARARAAKACNVTLALRERPGTLCAGATDLRRLAKDVDSAWLRYALDLTLPGRDDVAEALAKSVIAFATIGDADTFATANDPAAEALIERLARFRGFLVLEPEPAAVSAGAYHRAVERFLALRYRALTPAG